MRDLSAGRKIWRDKRKITEAIDDKPAMLRNKSAAG
jgi:hypothetical protein